MNIHPQPKRTKMTGEEFIFGKKMTLTIGEGEITPSQKKLFQELYRNFTCGVGKLCIRTVSQKNGMAIFSNAEESIPAISNIQAEYAIEIAKEKAILTFRDYSSFAHAFFTLLSLIEVRGKVNALSFSLPVGKIEDEPTVSFRGIHFCVFPETKLYMLKKFIRLAGFVKYSHVVLEFFGMYKYRCCKAMGWKNAYTHRQMRGLVKEANAMGMEVIPMVNCFGHAAQSRACYGRHVALDNNPKLAPYFEPDGWTWNLQNPDALALMKQMREELIDLCGEGSYFHIGCDEAFSYGMSRIYDGIDALQVLVDHINSIAAEMKAKGRRVMMWGDQLLYPKAGWDSSNYAFAETQEMADRLLAGIDKSIIINDWQYEVRQEDMPTSKHLASQGFEVILAPWDDIKATKICVDNITKYGYYGLMQTTWFVLNGEKSGYGGGIQTNLHTAELFWNGNVGNVEGKSRWNSYLVFLAGEYYRKLMPAKGRYKNCGIRRHEIEV